MTGANLGIRDVSKNESSIDVPYNRGYRWYQLAGKFKYRLLVFSMAVFVSLPLLWMAAFPAQIVRITLSPNQQVVGQGVVLSTGEILTDVANGVAHFEVSVRIDAPDVRHVRLSIHPSQEAVYYDSQAVDVQASGLAILSGQLASSRYPISGTSSYAFRVIDADDSSKILIHGSVMATVQTIAGSDRLIIIAISLLASFLQILVHFAKKEE